jgi:hypothetical protein
LGDQLDWQLERRAGGPTAPHTLLHIGVRGVGTVEQRAQAYIHYLHECLDNPAIVGAHWFRYADQPVSGRSDGENYLIGFVDVCDNPYPELTAALREIGYNAYRYPSTAIPQ